MGWRCLWVSPQGSLVEPHMEHKRREESRLQASSLRNGHITTMALPRMEET